MDKKEHILDVAQLVFAEKGYEGASIRDLASQAGINVAMISYYFGSKEKLFQAMLKRKVQFMYDKIQELIQDSTSDAHAKMERLIDAYVEKVFHNCDFQRIIYRELSLGKSGKTRNIITSMMRHNIEGIEHIIKDGQKTGRFKKDIDIPLTIATLLGTIVQTVQPTSSVSLVYNIRMDNEKDVKQLITRVKKHLKQVISAYLYV